MNYGGLRRARRSRQDLKPLNLFALPAIVALLAKIVLLSAARFSALRTRESEIFAALLLALAVQNSAEVAMFSYDGPTDGVISLPGGFVYFGASIVAVGLLLHLIMVMVSRGKPLLRREAVAIYAPVALLEFALWATPWLVEGFVPERFTYTRVPGPLYPLFSVYVLGCLGLTAWMLVRCALTAADRSLRRKARLVLVAVTPMITVAIAVVTLQSMSITVISTPLYFAVCVTFFLVMMAYAIYDNRLFSISFPIAWKTLFRRKTTFHESLRGLVAEIDDLPSNHDVLNRIAALFGCPVAIVAPSRCIGSPEAGRIVSVPMDVLSSFGEITVATDLEHGKGEAVGLKSLMKAYGMAAVVPFRNRASRSPAWLLLGAGGTQGEALDFDLVEDLCQKLSERFLDTLTRMRESTDSTVVRMQEIDHQMTTLSARILSLENDNDVLRRSLDSATQAAPVDDSAAADDRVAAEDDAPVENDDTASVEHDFDALRDGATLDTLMASYETRLIEEALRRCDGNKAQAARTLGLRANTLHYKVTRYGIESKKGATNKAARGDVRGCADAPSKADPT